MGWLLSAPLRGWVLLAAAASLLLNLALIVPALYMLQVFDRVFASRSVETLVMLALFTLLALGLAFCMDRARSLLLARAGRCIDETLAAPALVASLGGAARGREDATQGALPDIARLRHFLSGPAVQALFDAPWLPVYLLAIHALHPALGAAALVSAGLLFVLGVIAEGHARADGTALLEGRQQAGRHLDALHRQAEVLLGMGMLRRAVEGWQAMQQRLHGLQDGLDATGASLAALGRAMRQGVQAGMLTLGAWLVIDGHASPGIMIAATLLVGRALQPVEQLIAGWRALVEVRAAWTRLQQPLPDGARPAASSAPTSGEAPMRLPALRGALSLEGLHYRADPQRPPLIRQLSLEVPAGTCLGLVGGSGAGKTTLLRLMLGLRHPQTGSVRLDGIALENWPQDQLEGAIGYLPQDVSLFAGSVAQNIARLGPVDSAAVLAAAQLAGVHGLVSRLPQAYETELGEAGARLSGGQRQRLGLARAVYGDPKLVVLDEPNAHLDSEGEDALGAAIIALKQRGTTVVIVSHRPALMRHADQLAVLRDGTLEMAGPRDAVLARLHGATVHALRRTPTPAPSSAQPSPATAAATDATDDVQAEHPASRQASAGASA